MGANRCLLYDGTQSLYLDDGIETTVYDGGHIIMRFDGPKCTFLASDRTARRLASNKAMKQLMDAVRWSE